MASVSSLREHLVEELNDLLNAEQQLIEALPKMAERASSRELRAAFKGHLAETKTHERRVAQALKQLGEKPEGKTCDAMKGLLEEGRELMESGEPGALQDAMLITAAQKVEHYEIATYGTVRTYAQVVGERGVANLLAQTLKDEKAADKKLTRLAVGSINARAAKEWHEQSTAAALLKKSTEWMEATVTNVKRMIPRAQAADRGAARATKSKRSRKR